MSRIVFVANNKRIPSDFERPGSAWLDGHELPAGQMRVAGRSGRTPAAFVEGERTNLFLHSATPAEQVITGSGPITVSMSGRGRVLLDAGARGNVSAEFPVALDLQGSITLTPTGDVAWVQAEDGAYRTSHIPTASTPATRAAEAWTAEVDLNGMVSIAGLMQFGRPSFTPWLTAEGLEVGQDGKDLRVTIDTETMLLRAPLAWLPVTLLPTDTGTLVIINGQAAGELPVQLSTLAPITLGGDTILAPGTHPLGVPLTEQQQRPWGVADVARRHKRWLRALNSLKMHQGPAAAGLDLGTGSGPFYNALW